MTGPLRVEGSAGEWIRPRLLPWGRRGCPAGAVVPTGFDRIVRVLHPAGDGRTWAEVAATNDRVNYSLGSVLNHVLLHQTVIGLETIKQLELFGEQMPDQLFACAGGGSNLGGIALPFLRENLDGRASTTSTACESAAAPSPRRRAGRSTPRTPSSNSSS